MYKKKHNIGKRKSCRSNDHSYNESNIKVICDNSYFSNFNFHLNTKKQNDSKSSLDFNNEKVSKAQHVSGEKNKLIEVSKPKLKSTKNNTRPKRTAGLNAEAILTAILDLPPKKKKKFRFTENEQDQFEEEEEKESVDVDEDFVLNHHRCKKEVKQKNINDKKKFKKQELNAGSKKIINKETKSQKMVSIQKLKKSKKTKSNIKTTEKTSFVYDSSSSVNKMNRRKRGLKLVDSSCSPINLFLFPSSLNTPTKMTDFSANSSTSSKFSCSYRKKQVIHKKNISSFNNKTIKKKLVDSTKNKKILINETNNKKFKKHPSASLTMTTNLKQNQRPSKRIASLNASIFLSTYKEDTERVQRSDKGKKRTSHNDNENKNHPTQNNKNLIDLTYEEEEKEEVKEIKKKKKQNNNENEEGDDEKKKLCKNDQLIPTSTHFSTEDGNNINNIYNKNNINNTNENNSKHLPKRIKSLVKKLFNSTATATASITTSSTSISWTSNSYANINFPFNSNIRTTLIDSVNNTQSQKIKNIYITTNKKTIRPNKNKHNKEKVNSEKKKKVQVNKIDNKSVASKINKTKFQNKVLTKTPSSIVIATIPPHFNNNIPIISNPQVHNYGKYSSNNPNFNKSSFQQQPQCSKSYPHQQLLLPKQHSLTTSFTATNITHTTNNNNFLTNIFKNYNNQVYSLTKHFSSNNINSQLPHHPQSIPQTSHPHLYQPPQPQHSALLFNTNFNLYNSSPSSSSLSLSLSSSPLQYHPYYAPIPLSSPSIISPSSSSSSLYPQFTFTKLPYAFNYQPTQPFVISNNNKHNNKIESETDPTKQTLSNKMNNFNKTLTTISNQPNHNTIASLSSSVHNIQASPKIVHQPIKYVKISPKVTNIPKTSHSIIIKNPSCSISPNSLFSFCTSTSFASSSPLTTSTSSIHNIFLLKKTFKNKTTLIKNNNKNQNNNDLHEFVKEAEQKYIRKKKIKNIIDEDYSSKKNKNNNIIFSNISNSTKNSNAKSRNSEFNIVGKSIFIKNCKKNINKKKNITKNQGNNNKNLHLKDSKLSRSLVVLVPISQPETSIIKTSTCLNSKIINHVSINHQNENTSYAAKTKSRENIENFKSNKVTTSTSDFSVECFKISTVDSISGLKTTSTSLSTSLQSLNIISHAKVIPTCSNITFKPLTHHSKSFNSSNLFSKTKEVNIENSSVSEKLSTLHPKSSLGVTFVASNAIPNVKNNDNISISGDICKSIFTKNTSNCTSINFSEFSSAFALINASSSSTQAPFDVEKNNDFHKNNFYEEIFKINNKNSKISITSNNAEENRNKSLFSLKTDTFKIFSSHSISKEEQKCKVANNLMTSVAMVTTTDNVCTKNENKNISKYNTVVITNSTSSNKFNKDDDKNKKRIQKVLKGMRIKIKKHKVKNKSILKIKKNNGIIQINNKPKKFGNKFKETLNKTKKKRKVPRHSLVATSNHKIQNSNGGEKHNKAVGNTQGDSSVVSSSYLASSPISSSSKNYSTSTKKETNKNKLNNNININNINSNLSNDNSKLSNKMINKSNTTSSSSNLGNISNTWTWVGKSFYRNVGFQPDGQLMKRKCFESVKHECGDVIGVKDCVLVRSGKRRKNVPFIAKIYALWEEGVEEMMMGVFWFYRKEHLESDSSNPRGTNLSSRNVASRYLNHEVFASRHRDVVPVACIEDKCHVLPYDLYCRYRACLIRKEWKAPESLVSKVVPPPSFFCSISSSLPISFPQSFPSSSSGHNSTDYIDYLVNEVDKWNIFLCRHTYDIKLKRISKNPHIPILSTFHQHNIQNNISNNSINCINTSIITSVSNPSVVGNNISSCNINSVCSTMSTGNAGLFDPSNNSNIFNNNNNNNYYNLSCISMNNCNNLNVEENLNLNNEGLGGGFEFGEPTQSLLNINPSLNNISKFNLFSNSHPRNEATNNNSTNVEDANVINNFFQNNLNYFFNISTTSNNVSREESSSRSLTSEADENCSPCSSSQVHSTSTFSHVVSLPPTTSTAFYTPTSTSLSSLSSSTFFTSSYNINASHSSNLSTSAEIIIFNQTSLVCDSILSKNSTTDTDVVCNSRIVNMVSNGEGSGEPFTPVGGLESKTSCIIISSCFSNSASQTEINHYNSNKTNNNKNNNNSFINNNNDENNNDINTNNNDIDNNDKDEDNGSENKLTILL